MRHSILLLLTSCSVLSGGCMYGGPHSLKVTRPDYNIAIQQTNEQELLLNLTRLKYRDSLYFLTVEKVASTVELSSKLSAGAEFPVGAFGSYKLGEASVSMAEKPTIFYAPVDGERFARQMMTIINPDIFVLLANSGWSIERLMSVVLQEMNGLKNAPSATGPTPSYEPIYADFRIAVKHLRTLQVKKLLDVGRIDSGSSNHLELRFQPQASSDPDAMEFRRLLGLDPLVANFKVVVGLGKGGTDTINVVPRSLVGVMNYLSQGVEAPALDIEAGRVTRTIANSGELFDWQAVLGGLFRVHSADSAPDNAAVAIQYRGSWFYIRDNDLESKSTFSLLSQLVALQASPNRRDDTPISFSIGGR